MHTCWNKWVWMDSFQKEFIMKIKNKDRKIKNQNLFGMLVIQIQMKIIFLHI